jgi:iron complex outermembrane receptor protein
MRKLRIAAAFFAGASTVALSTATFAQASAPAAPADDSTVGEIIVTGSRVIKNGDASPSPVTVVATEDVLRMQPGTLADALQILPVFAGSRGSGVNPTSTGSVGAGNASANQLNLRNIGPNRTLVLIDGLRVPPTLLNGVVDVDVIPQMLVQRVDTVTGGVSAVYGSDAVSGVVNYVIDKKFNGLKALAQTGVSSEGDGKKVDVGFAVGKRLGDRGHFEGSYEYRNEKGIAYRSDRDWMTLWGVAGAGTTANPYQLYSNVHQSAYSFGGLINSGVLNGQTFNTGGTLRPFVHGATTGSAALEIGGDGAYYDSSLLASLKGNQVFGRFDYDLTDSVHGYAQASANIKTNANYSDYLTLNRVTINSQNAFLNPTYRAQLAAANQATFTLSELVASAPRLEARSKSDQRIYTGGLDGDLGAYKWSLDYTHGTTELRTTLVTNINNQRLAAALDAVSDATGKIVCNITLTNPSSGCVPLNVFGSGAASAEAINYVMQPTHYIASTTMDALSGHIDGSPFSTWAGPVGVALSGEWRKLSFESRSDASPTDLVNCTGIRYNCTAGGALWTQTYAASPEVSQTVKEAALEFDAPLVKDAALMQSLSLNGAARFTRYDTSGDYWTWKIGFDWRVNDALRFRGTKSRDIRAPTLYELFAPVNSVPVNPVDLLTNTSPRVPSTDLSNPDLTAEIGKTTTAGLIWNPLPRLSIALDGYHITVTDAVAQIAGSTAAYQQACYASGGTSPFCALQVRPNGYTDKSAANAVTRWYTKYQNIAEIETWGADLEVNYSATLFDRPASLRFLGAWQPHVYYRQPGAPTTDQGGVAFGPLGMAAGPDLRLTGLFRFQPAPHLTIDLMQRWRDSMKLGGDPTQVWVKNRIASFGTTNLSLTYETDALVGRTELFLNVQNLFDNDAPGGAYSGNGTRAGMRDGYAIGDDVLGRYFTIGARLKL